MIRVFSLLAIVLLILACRPLAGTTTQAPSPPPQEQRYLLPPGFAETFVVPGDERTFADAQGFQVALIPRGATPGPETTILIGGGSAAEDVWAANQPGGQGAVIELILIRGVEGTVASSGQGITMAWVEAGRPYFVSMPSPDEGAVQIFVNSLASHDLAEWRDMVGLE